MCIFKHDCYTVLDVAPEVLKRMQEVSARDFAKGEDRVVIRDLDITIQYMQNASPSNMVRLLIGRLYL